MVKQGFDPDFPDGTAAEISVIRNAKLPQPSASIRDLRQFLWSSIDNQVSRDLDQIELAERTDDGIRVLVGIANVSQSVRVGSQLDAHASSQTTTVYTAARIFPMLPIELSTDLTSLNQNEDRPAIVIEMLVNREGLITSSEIYRALVRNKAQLAYEDVGPWLAGSGPAPTKVAASTELAAQLKLQDEAACLIRAQRVRLGALNFERVEASPVMDGNEVKGVTAVAKNRAGQLIEDFMIAANESMATNLRRMNRSGIQRVVKSPERWPRIRELAQQCGNALPDNPDAPALARFLKSRQAADPDHYSDLSLSIIKLLGPGEYMLVKPGDAEEGHFSLAVHDYTHSTAPNRRFADLVTQRIITAGLDGDAPPYADDDLAKIAANCTLKEDAARKVERNMSKRVAAVAMANRIGQSFQAIVTGVTPKGVFVRVVNPPVEGRLMRGEAGVDVGDKFQVKLVNTDPQHGFVDFGR